MPRKRTKSKKKYTKGGKLKLGAEEWEEQTDISSFPKVKKIEVVLKEIKKPAEEEIKLIPVEKEKELNEIVLKEVKKEKE